MSRWLVWPAGGGWCLACGPPRVAATRAPGTLQLRKPYSLSISRGSTVVGNLFTERAEVVMFCCQDFLVVHTRNQEAFLVQMGLCIDFDWC